MKLFRMAITVSVLLLARMAGGADTESTPAKPAAAESVPQKVEADVKAAAKEVKEVAIEVGHRTSEAAKEVGHATKKVAKKVGHRTKKAAIVVGHETKKAARAVGEAAKEGAHEVKEAVTSDK